MATKRRSSARRASGYNACVGKELRGRHFASAEAARAAMKKAAKHCAGR